MREWKSCHNSIDSLTTGNPPGFLETVLLVLWVSSLRARRRRGVLEHFWVRCMNYKGASTSFPSVQGRVCRTDRATTVCHDHSLPNIRIRAFDVSFNRAGAC